MTLLKTNILIKKDGESITARKHLAIFNVII